MTDRKESKNAILGELESIKDLLSEEELADIPVLEDTVFSASESVSDTQDSEADNASDELEFPLLTATTDNIPTLNDTLELPEKDATPGAIDTPEFEDLPLLDDIPESPQIEAFNADTQEAETLDSEIETAMDLSELENEISKTLSDIDALPSTAEQYTTPDFDSDTTASTNDQAAAMFEDILQDAKEQGLDTSALDNFETFLEISDTINVDSQFNATDEKDKSIDDVSDYERAVSDEDRAISDEERTISDDNTSVSQNEQVLAEDEDALDVTDEASDDDSTSDTWPTPQLTPFTGLEDIDAEQLDQKIEQVLHEVEPDNLSEAALEDLSPKEHGGLPAPLLAPNALPGQQSLFDVESKNNQDTLLPTADSNTDTETTEAEATEADVPKIVESVEESRQKIENTATQSALSDEPVSEEQDVELSDTAPSDNDLVDNDPLASELDHLEQSLAEITQDHNAAAPETSEATFPSSMPKSTPKSTKGENPFLPKHIRDRLHTDRSLIDEIKSDPANTSNAAAKKILEPVLNQVNVETTEKLLANDIDQRQLSNIISDVLREQMPVIEEEIRKRLLKSLNKNKDS